MHQLCEQGHYVADGQFACLEGHALMVERGVTPDEPLSIASVPPEQDEGISMADEMTYNNGYHYVRDNSNDQEVLATLIAAGNDANRDVADAGRDLTGFIGTSSQHVDIMSAVREEGGEGRQVTERARGDLASDILAASKENVVVTLQEGSRGRETTLEAKSDLMREHCETQKLVIKEACETREAVHDEGNRTRELIRDEHRALLQRELDASQEENTLLKLQLNILSGGGGVPLSARQ